MSSGKDKRATDALNMFYGNRTFLATMRGQWNEAKVVHAYMYGHGLQVLYSAIGLQDIYRMFSPFPYEIEVAVDAISINPLNDKTWKGVVTEWAGLTVDDSSYSSASQDDTIVLVDIHKNAGKKVIKRAVELFEMAVRQKVKILIVNEAGLALPKDIAKHIGRFAGSENNLLNPFMSRVVDSSIGSQARNNIFVYGSSLRTITTAMGAADHLTRRQGGKSKYYQLASRVILDTTTPELGNSALSYSDVLEKLGIAYTDVALIALPLDRDGPNLQPLVKG